jgi:hypothetical protein
MIEELHTDRTDGGGEATIYAGSRDGVRMHPQHTIQERPQRSGCL